MKIKKLFTLRDSINKVKRQPTEWEKIFPNHLFDKGLVSRMYRELLKQHTHTQNQIQKWAKDLNRHFSKKDM